MKARIKFSKQILSILLCLAIVLSYVPMTAYAASSDKSFDLGNGFILTIHGGKVYHNWGNERYHNVTGVNVVHNNYSYETAKYVVNFDVQFYCDHDNSMRTIEDPIRIEFPKSSNPFKCDQLVSVTNSRDRNGNYTYTLTRAATEHDCTATTKAATCSAPQTTTYSRCNLCYHTPDPVTTGGNDPDNHSWGSWVSNNNGTHTRVCTLNSTHKETNDCSGGENSCDSPAICSTCSMAYGTSKGHSYTYAKTADNVLTETCGNGCEHSAKATLSAMDSTYTGSAVTTAEIKYDDNWKGANKPTAITYSNNTNAGTATAAITVEDYELSTSFQIKNIYTVSFDANGGTESKDSEQVMDGEEYTLPANPFTAPSGYWFKGWAYSANGDVIQDEAITISSNITLYAIWEKIPAEVPTVAVSGNLTLTYGEYTDQKFTATVEKRDGYTYSYQWIDNNTVISTTDTLTIPDTLAAGEYDYYLAVAAKRIDNGEIAWYRNRDIFVKVTSKELSAANVALSQSTFTYNGDEQKPDVTVTVNGNTLVEGTDYTISWPADCKNADVKTVTVTFEGNYSGTAQKSFEIMRKEIDISWGPTGFLPYNGNSLVPAATAVNLVEGDTCTLTTDVVKATDVAGVIPGIWTAKVTALSNSNYKLPESGERVTIQFEIVNGYQNYAPEVSGVDETICGKADGKITGVDSTMEYRKEGEDTYTAISGTEVTNLEAGTYYVRYAAKTYYNPSPDKTVVINAGRKLTVTVPQNQVGYTLMVDKTEFEYMGGPKITLVIHDGYSKTEDFAVKLNGNDMQWGDFTEIGTQSITEDVIITVDGIADITAPVAEINIKENKWSQFWNDITFGLFFKETQDVTVVADDRGSGINAVYYYLAERELALDEVKSIGNDDWKEYNGTFQINPDNEYIVYVKVTDNAGNTLYINSAGIVLDKTLPDLVGIVNGEAYYGDKRFKALDDYLATLKVDGVDVTAELNGDNEYKIIADNAEHTVTAIDEAENVTEYKITVYKNYTVTYKVDGEAVKYTDRWIRQRCSCSEHSSKGRLYTNRTRLG